MINTVIFDFDGTLINTNDVIIEAWQYTYKHYLGHEVPVGQITKCFGEPLLITMAREFPGVPAEESAEIYRNHQRAKADELVKLFDGIEDMLKAVKETGCKIGIVTSRTKESTLFYINKFGIGDYFDGIVSCDDTDKHKPDPAPLLLGLDRLGASPAEAIMVGDSAFDIKCANNAGVRAVLVDWRMTGDDQKLRECNIDYEIKEPMELPEVLRKAK